MKGPRLTSERLRALDFRLMSLRACADSLEALAQAGEQILSADAQSPQSKVTPYPIRASIIVMVCATIEGILTDIGNATKEAEQFTLAPSDFRGSSLDQARTFFKKVAGLPFPDKTQTWSKLRNLFELRNALVHTWGPIGDEKRRKSISSLHGIVVSPHGEANLSADAVSEALRIMRDFANELEEYMGPQGGASTA